jgi:hypothetical protein
MERFVAPTLDYSKVRTLEEFQHWAALAFELPYVDGATHHEISLALFNLLNVDDQHLVVLEANKRRMSSDMVRLMTDPVHGIYPVLGFHLPREGKGALVGFRNLSWWQSLPFVQFGQSNTRS